jgi:hypothetical protein
MLRLLRIVGMAALSLAGACGRGDRGAAQREARVVSPASAATSGRPLPDAASARRPADNGLHSNVGFRSRAQFNEHFQKHGAEFGHVSQQEYLRQAQALREAPVGASIEEIRRDDGTVSRFDRSTGAFLAFNRDGTIRTFFKPNDGEGYFTRQASRVH